MAYPDDDRRGYRRTHVHGASHNPEFNDTDTMSGRHYPDRRGQPGRYNERDVLVDDDYDYRGRPGYNRSTGRRYEDYREDSDDRRSFRDGGRGRPRRAPDRDRDFFDRASDEVRSWFGDDEAERRRDLDERYGEGPYAGRGPAGYERSPERINDDVCERLTRHGYLDASDISVAVDDHEVTLEGTVDSRRSKRLAEDLAEEVPGVRDVHNRLRIDWEGDRKASDKAKRKTTTKAKARSKPSKETDS